MLENKQEGGKKEKKTFTLKNMYSIFLFQVRLYAHVSGLNSQLENFYPIWM